LLESACYILLGLLRHGLSLLRQLHSDNAPVLLIVIPGDQPPALQILDELGNGRRGNLHHGAKRGNGGASFILSTTVLDAEQHFDFAIVPSANRHLVPVGTAKTVKRLN